MRYCIWNNKGGVGKTFLTYCLSVEYALKHPTTTVVVVDMCPQANVSEVLLGGNGIGEENLLRCYENNRTIANYIKSRYDTSRFGKVGNEIGYFVQVKNYNDKMPSNLYLLPGDMDLDICSTLIDYIASAPEKNAWAKSRNYLIDLLGVFEKEQKVNPVFFIDSNPSFANYTQLGLIASDRLIIPCTADSASIRGISNVLRLVHGIKDNNRLSDEAFDTFHSKISDAGIKPPSVCTFALNKARTLDKKASVAYKAHVEEIGERIIAFEERFPSIFTTLETDRRILSIKDCNTIAPVLNYTGCAPSALQHKKYDVYGQQTQVNQSQIDSFFADIDKLVSVL
ncbi:ATPase [Planctomycetales bacterium]|nr:ATPase [Planctomycetales bacterium]